MKNEEKKVVTFIKPKQQPNQESRFDVDYGYNSFVNSYFPSQKLTEMIYKHLNEGYEIRIKKLK